VVVETLGRQVGRSACDWLTKSARGDGRFQMSAAATTGKKPQRGQSPRGHLALVLTKPQANVRDSAWCEKP